MERRRPAVGKDFVISACSGRLPGGPGRALFAFVILAVGASLVSCADTYGARRVLARSIDEFNAQVRWGRQEQASAYLIPKLRKDYLDRVERLGEKIRITEVDILRVILRKGGKQAVVRVRFKWQRRDDILLHQSLIAETWVQKGKDWVLVRIRQLGKPMPLLPLGPRSGETDQRNGQ